jgi:hypothetical protein
MTQRYSHLSPAALVETVRLLEMPAVGSERGEILETEKGRERKLHQLTCSAPSFDLAAHDAASSA